MESYFLSETVKYLYLSFVDSAPLLDYYVLSTEGHLMPAFSHSSDKHIEEDLEQESSSSESSSSSSGSSSSSSSSSSDRDAGEATAASDHVSDSCQGSRLGSCAAPAPLRAAAAPGHADADSSDESGSNSTEDPPAAPAAVGDTSIELNVSSLVGRPLASLPANCRSLCEVRSAAEEASFERRLHTALPLLPVRRVYSRRIR